MNTFNEGDKVIYTDENGNDWDAQFKRTEVIDDKDVVVISMNGGWPIYVHAEQVRATNRTKKIIANDIVRKLKKIDSLRTELDHLYSDLHELLEEDGQPQWETKLVEVMQTVHRNILRLETTNMLTEWEGYRDNRPE